MIEAFTPPPARGKLPSPPCGGRSENLSAHPSTEPGQLQNRDSSRHAPHTGICARGSEVSLGRFLQDQLVQR